MKKVVCFFLLTVCCVASTLYSQQLTEKGCPCTSGHTKSEGLCAKCSCNSGHTKSEGLCAKCSCNSGHTKSECLCTKCSCNSGHTKSEGLCAKCSCNTGHTKSEVLFEDDLDDLVDQAIDNGTLSKNIQFKELTKFQRFALKFGLPFVRLYTFSVFRYREFKGWVAALWSNLKTFRLYSWLSYGQDDDETEEARQT